jgi:hypothetical protein
LADKLLKSAPRDKKSLQIIEDRDEEQKTMDRAEKERSDAEHQKKQADDEKRIAALKKSKQLSTRMDAAKKLRAKMKARQQADDELKKMLDDDQQEFEKEQIAKGKVIRKKKRVKYFKQKWGFNQDDEDWVPEPKKKLKSEPKKKKKLMKPKPKKIPVIDLT